MSRTILYIGNNLSKQSNYKTTLETLSSLLIKEKYTLILSSNKKNKVLRLLDMIFTLLMQKKKLNYVLIDTFSTKNFYFAFIISQLCRFYKIKYLPILHGGNLPFRLDKSSKTSKLIFSNSYKNVAPSNYLKSEFEKRGYDAIYIPNTLEIEKYIFKKREQIKPNLLWVRSFKELYNPTLAIEVLFLIKKEFPSAKLCMVGPEIDNSFNETKKMVNEYDLNDSVKFTGVLPSYKWHKVSELYDVFINTTNFDNTPISVMEAMALGLTIVSTNAGGMPYLINNYEDGILVEKGNPKQMADEIINIIKLNNTNLSSKAREKVENFSWDVVREKWLDILK
ncbi:glycosyltransferase family 4 protein [Polaribacter aestuariivivens]|uniref:Glycosyltransferase family 4 protein n=1 Tax=Polaribacter aestuariivivens TaxID=2304626 RepID=A0A5S3NDU1_9FLAO|nr:glycosyltransferase family 4 protein [Polaribacter aestuariivivens]TMM31336.1 glycosyltransferase family 4 protein [Polaribacter aestuariivivens]